MTVASISTWPWERAPGADAGIDATGLEPAEGQLTLAALCRGWSALEGRG